MKPLLFILPILAWCATGWAMYTQNGFVFFITALVGGQLLFWAISKQQ